MGAFAGAAWLAGEGQGLGHAWSLSVGALVLYASVEGIVWLEAWYGMWHGSKRLMWHGSKRLPGPENAPLHTPPLTQPATCRLPAGGASGG